MNLTIPRPDDWHLHLRDGSAMAAVLPHTARQFARAIVMPNLTPPVTTVAQANAYRQRILDALPDGLEFEPLMTLYLTDNTSVDEIRRAVESPFVHAVKLYPAGATTNSDSGVTDIDKVMAVIEHMAEAALPLLVHGEVTNHQIDIFDRERIFIEQILEPLLARLPALRLVLEHITTRDGIAFVESKGDNVAGTLTAHHLLYNRNAMLAGGIRPHYYCLPILKRETHREALLQAATSGSRKFFLGTDSAPHAQNQKESPCGCAGCFTAHAAIELYAEAFEQAGALDQLEAFASLNGPAFYRLPVNEERISLQRESWTVPDSYPMGEDNRDQVVPLRAGEQIRWKIID